MSNLTQIAAGIFLLTLLVAGCNSTAPTLPPATQEPATAPPVTATATALPPTETPEPTFTPPPPPDVGATVEPPQDEPIPISAGGTTVITLAIATEGDFEVTFDPGAGHIAEKAEGVYEYTAPDVGGTDTVRFEVTGAGGTTTREIVFQVISVTISSPTEEVACASTVTCGVTVGGSATGLDDEMQVVVFVNPLDSNIDAWWRYPVASVTADGKWQEEVFIREDRPVFAGDEFALTALVLPREMVPTLPHSMAALPEGDLASARVVSLRTVSSRPPLGEPKYPGEITITSPADSTRSLVHGRQVTAMGTAGNMPAAQEIWALIYVEEVSSYFPQNHTACPNAAPASRSGSAWEAPNLSFGGEGEMQYDIVVIAVEAESETSAFLRDYLTNGCRTGDFFGFSAAQLAEEGITHEEAAITVVAGDG